MKTSKIVIKNLFGIRETTLDGKSVEISGPKGAGKTSVLDAIRFALTNRSERDCIVHQGADEGEIIIETTTGLSIDRKALPAKSAGTVKVRDGSLLQTRPAEFLSQIFTPLQLNPVEFTQLSRQEKNRVILSLIEFDWDVNWIREQFGEIPQGVDYPRTVLCGSETLRGRMAERCTLPLLGLGRVCSRRVQRACGTAMCLCASLFRRRRGPAGLRCPCRLLCTGEP